MTTLGNNNFPSVLTAERSAAPALPTSGQKLYMGTDGNLHYIDPGGLVRQVGGSVPENTSKLLAITNYGGGTSVNVTSTSLVDLDAANLSITFTAPASGNIVIKVAASVLISGGQFNVDAMFLGFREGVNDIAEHFVGHGNGYGDIRIAARFYLTGVSAGSHTYKLAGCSSANTLYVREFSNAPVTIEVWST